ncbi:Heterokaryon incompatibility protein (HET) domain containing protein [Hyaloscypha variabilis]
MSIPHDKLDRTKNEIRLISFHRNNTSPLQISLKTVSKDENPSYHCLSYVWGDPTPIWPIVVNDAQVLIAKNLGEALQRVADEKDVEFLWVDALCINQEDEEKKMHQVHMMNNIYSGAVAVLAWLGPEADGSGDVMDEISRVGGMLVGKLSITPYPKGAEEFMTAAMQTSWHKFVLLMLGWIEFLTDPKRTGQQKAPDFWQDLDWENPERRLGLEKWAAFCSRPYWSRVWILQELAISRDAFILCAISRIPFDILVLQWIYEIQKTSDDAPILKCLQDFIGDASDNQKDIMRLLGKSGAMGATVPQDRIFALAALSTHDLELEFDYAKPLHDYLENIIKNRCLRRGFQLEPLNIETCAWAEGSPSRVTEEHRGVLLNLLASIKFNYICLDHDISILEDQKSWPQDFNACGKGPFPVSEANFPRARVLKLECHMLGHVEGVQRLEATDEEETHFQALIGEAFKAKEEGNFGNMLTHSWLVAMNSLQKMVAFHGGPEPRKLSDLDTSEFKDNKDELSRNILSLFLRPPPEPRDFYQKYEDAVHAGFLLVCSTSENFLDIVNEDAELWAIVGQVVKTSSFYIRCLEAMCVGRSTFKTKEGRIGVGPEIMQAGDCVVIIPGVGVPYIVRPVESGIYKLVGGAYVPDIMYGEYMDQEKVPESTWMEFC